MMSKIKKLLLSATAAAVLSTTSALAADMGILKAPAAPPAVTCSATSCTGFFGGAFFGGLGNNANIIGNGINGSINSGGMIPGVEAGYQWFDGSFLFGLEVMGGYQFNSSVGISSAAGSASGDHAGMFGIILAKTGVPLSTLAPSFSIPNLPLAIVTPYLAGGEMIQAHGGTGGVAGGGIEFALPSSAGVGSSNFVDVMYLNGGGAGTAGSVSTSNNNMVFAKFDHLF